MTTRQELIEPGWKVLLKDLGISPINVLRRAGLPDDLLNRERVQVSTEELFRLFRGVEAEADDPLLPLTIAEALTVEVFSPPIFAALCSPDLNTALGRLAKYKRLIAAKVLHLEITEDATEATCQWLDKTAEPPELIVLFELAFLVKLARMATRERIEPLAVRSPVLPDQRDAYTDYFGVPVRRGDAPTVRFAATDATRPFMTANEGMWSFFEAELNRRLADLDDAATTEDRVHSALLELLPGGAASMSSVAKKLGVSTRTLHRRLAAEQLTFQRVLDSTREALAIHYLRSSSMTGAEIAFLLGYEDPNSFFRAFSTWTGTTPERTRRELLSSTRPLEP